MTAHILITGKGPGLRRPEDQRREDTGRNTTGGCKIGGNSSLEFKLDKRIGTIFLSSSGSSLTSCLTPCQLLVKFTKRQERTMR